MEYLQIGDTLLKKKTSEEDHHLLFVFTPKWSNLIKKVRKLPQLGIPITHLSPHKLWATAIRVGPERWHVLKVLFSAQHCILVWYQCKQANRDRQKRMHRHVGEYPKNEAKKKYTRCE